MPRKSARLNRSTDISYGFTLIELLVVISILIIVTAATVPSFAGYTRNQAIKQAMEQVKSDLRSIQNKAITGALSDLTVNSNPVTYWAVRFSGAGNYEYFISDNASSCPNSFSSGQLQGNASVAEDIEIKSSGNMCIFFSISNGNITAVNFSGNTLIIGYEGSVKNGDCRRIHFNSSGLIYSGTSQSCT